MKTGPDIAAVAALIGDPARANMLAALMAGVALTATELAAEAGVTAPTASSHLARLVEGGLVVPTKQGRHRYYRLTDGDVAAAIEALMGVAARTGRLRSRFGPREPALRKARVCFDHLAGDKGVALFEALRGGGHLAVEGEGAALTASGRDLVARFGVEPVADRPRRPACRCCLDWSERRHHLAGPVGRAILARTLAVGWASRVDGTRIVAFTPAGERAFDGWLGTMRCAAA